MQLFENRAIGLGGGLDVADGFVKVGVERVPGLGDNFNETEFAEGAGKLFLELEQTVVQRRAFGTVVEGAFKIVERRQEGTDDAFTGEPGNFLAFTGDAFPVIVEVGGGAQEFVPVFSNLGFELFEFRAGIRRWNDSGIVWCISHGLTPAGTMVDG